MDTFEICRILQNELAGKAPEIHSLPMGDGGDGTAQVLAYYLHAEPVPLLSCDALNRECKTFYFRLKDTAIISLADICGLKQLNPREHDILNTNTRGVGIAINHALHQGIQKIILCAGGSASVDGGIGALEELGFTIVHSHTGYDNHLIGIENITHNDLIYKFKQIEFLILCDVENPLCGRIENPPDLFTQIFCLSDYAPSLSVSINHPQPYLRTIAGKIKSQLF